MNVLLSILINGIAVWLTAMVLPGVKLDGFLSALIVAGILSISNILIKPLLVFLALPATLITFGLFVFVIDALIFLLISNIVPGFSLESFWTALLFSFVLAVIASLLDMLVSAR